MSDDRIAMKSGPERFATIVADPPWRYSGMPIGGAKQGTVADSRPVPYPTMSVEEIRALPVPDLSADDSVLWLWTTNRYLRDAFTVAEAWGFRYSQAIVWAKNNPMPIGGRLAPQASEYLLGCLKGRPDVGKVFPSSVITTARPKDRRHSTKPECFLDYIEAGCPEPRLEMFARRNRMGWSAWGNEAISDVAVAT